MTSLENKLAAELEGELGPRPSYIPGGPGGIGRSDEKASVVPLRETSFVDQFSRMEKIGEALNVQVRMKVMELENQFRKRATEMSISHEREAQVLLATHKAEIDELEALLRKLR